MKSLLLAIFFIVSSVVSTLASEPAIENGFKAFKERGAEAACVSWAKGGPFEGSKELMAQASQFEQIKIYYGKYSSHEYVLSKKLGPKNKIVFVIINLEKGPLFARFLLFQNSEGRWILPNFKVQGEPEQIWPSELYTN